MLVLRDVLDWSAKEVADLLDDSVAAVNSAPQRARETLSREREAGTWTRVHAPAGADVEAALMQRFQDACERIELVPTSFDGQPALAAYVDGKRIAGITGFPERGGVFAALGLPAYL